MDLSRRSPQMALPVHGTSGALPFGKKGETPIPGRSEERRRATLAGEHAGTGNLMARVLTPANLRAALRRVQKNRGSPGVDGMTVEELPAYLLRHWPRLRMELQAGRYTPAPVLRREIPKAGGGARELGIPTALDRFLQQAMLQVLQPLFDPTFSAHSYGFRPGRSAHHAVHAAQAYVQAGRRWVVDVDIEKFFDRVNHDVLMGKLAARIADRTLLRLIRRYLEAGVMVSGVVRGRVLGTPQGGPLSPLLANVYLDEVDRLLERYGHAFVRYADDCNVYVRSARAGARVLRLLLRRYVRLHLRLNATKTAVAPVWHRQFLGFRFWQTRDNEVRRAVAKPALNAMKNRVRILTRRTGGQSMTQVAAQLQEFLLGWREYFQIAETPRVFRSLDEWIRHRLRALQLKQWKRGPVVYRELRARGMSVVSAAQVAAYTRQWWKNAASFVHVAFPNRHFDALGIPRLASRP